MRRDAGFAEVHDTVLERTGADLEWRRGAPSAAVEAQVRKLLAAELTPETAVAVAFLGNRELQATLEGLGVAQADLLEAGLLRNPLLGGELRFPASPVHPFEVTLAQPVLEIFLLPVRRRVAAAGFAAARLQVTDAVLNVEAETRATVYRVQAAGQALALARTLADAAAAAAALGERQQRAGNISDLDLATAQALAEQAKLEVARGEVEATAARERLQRDMGLDGPIAWKVAPQLPALPGAEPPLAGLETAALAKRQDLAALREEAEAAARALPLARTAGLGEADLGGHREGDAGGRTTTGPAATLSVPIFNWGQAARRRAEARYRQARDRYEGRTATARSEVREAWGRLMVARQGVELYRDTLVPLARNVVGLTQTSYDAMVVGVFQLLDAKKDSLRAERGAIEALRDYWLARTELERAVADRLPAAPTAAAPASPTAPALSSPMKPAEAPLPPPEPRRAHSSGGAS